MTGFSFVEILEKLSPARGILNIEPGSDDSDLAKEAFYIRRGQDIKKVSQEDCANLHCLGHVRLNGIVNHYYRG